MPMTCTAQNSQHYNTDIIAKIIATCNQRYMEMCICESLDTLKSEFFADAPCEGLELLRRYVSSDATVHTHKVAVFFLLLNIDEKMKQKMMQMDQNHAKLARFFLDLRKELVTVFFCTSQPANQFVQQCRETYLIA